MAPSHYWIEWRLLLHRLWLEFVGMRTNKVVSQVACPTAIGIFLYTQSTQSTLEVIFGKNNNNQTSDSVRLLPVPSGISWCSLPTELLVLSSSRSVTSVGLLLELELLRALLSAIFFVHVSSFFATWQPTNWLAIIQRSIPPIRTFDIRTNIRILEHWFRP